MRHARVLASIRLENSQHSRGGPRGQPREDLRLRRVGGSGAGWDLRNGGTEVGDEGSEPYRMGDDVPRENRRDAPSRLAARLRTRVLRRCSSLTARGIAVGVATLLVVPVAGGAGVAAYQSSRYSIADAAPRTAPPPYTLLDPNWLLPPVEALDAELPLA